MTLGFEMGRTFCKQVIVMKKIFYLLLCTVILGSCAEDAPIDTLGSVTGTVSDMVTGEPVPVVNVILYRYEGFNDEGLSEDDYVGSTVTGSDGSFSFEDLPAARYALLIGKEGYEDNYKIFYLDAGQMLIAHMLIERLPAIVTADRSILDFRVDKSNNTLSFNIVNSSYEDLDWEIEENSEWIKEVKPLKGVLAYGKTETIVVVIDRAKLSSGENHTVIVVRSSNGSTEIDVYATGEYRSKPAVETYDATNVRAYSATLNGEMKSLGEPEYTERGFVYSTAASPTIENSIAKIVSPKNSTDKFSCDIKNLALGKTYYVRAYATNSVGTAYGSYDVEFTTRPVMPSVTTLEINDMDYAEGSATLRGKIESAGEPEYTERGFVYATTPEPTINDERIVKGGTGTGTFSSYVTALPKGRTIYVRAYAINEAGVAYGNEISVIPEFITLSSANLMVQTKDLGCVDWNSADMMCKSSIVAGYSDWRLPTKEELMVLYNNKEKIGGFKLGSTDNSSSTYEWCYWSSSYYGSYNYYFVNFSSGETDYFGASRRYSVRAVRSIE